MSWSVNESSYPIETTVQEMEKREFELNYQNRGAYNPQPIHLRVLSPNRIFEDLVSAREYILNTICHGESACVKYKAPISIDDKKSSNYIAKIQKEIASLKEYSEKHTVDQQKAQFIGCKKCGSRLSRIHLKKTTTCLTRYSSFMPVQDENTGYRVVTTVNTCPVCSAYLQSDSIIEEISRREKKIFALRDEYRSHIKTRPGKVMWFVYSQLYIG